MWSKVYIIAIILMFGFCKEAKFKVKLITVTTCRKPASLMDPDLPINSSLLLKKINRDTTLVDCNITSTKRFGPVAVSYRAYQLQQNAQRDLIAKLERANCAHSVFGIAHQLHMRIDNDCYMLPGEYQYKNLDIDKFAPIITKSMAQPGKYGYEMEITSHKGIVSCAFVICDLSLRKI